MEQLHYVSRRALGLARTILLCRPEIHEGGRLEGNPAANKGKQSGERPRSLRLPELLTCGSDFEIVPGRRKFVSNFLYPLFNDVNLR
jgi:hypothetical protein